MKRTRVATGHDLFDSVVAENNRHADAIEDLRSAAYERRAVVQARLAELEDEDRVLGMVIA